MKSTTLPLLGITVIVGLEGDVEGSVLIDMSRETAQAAAKLYALGLKFDLSPPELITGQKLEGANAGVETLIVPIDIPRGRVEINVAVRKRI